MLRHPETGDDAWSILCPPCFAELAGESGVLEGATIWHFAPHGVDVESLWLDSDGRSWDSEECMWVESELRGGAALLAERLEEMRPKDETPEWQAYAFRAYGEGIQEIGMRAFDHELTPDEIAAVAFLARNALAWCGVAGGAALPPLDVERLAEAAEIMRQEYNKALSEFGNENPVLAYLRWGIGHLSATREIVLSEAAALLSATQEERER